MAETVRPRAYGVEEITYYLKEYLAEDKFLSSLAVRGEVSGFKRHASGHIYFTLREGNSSLKTVLFRRWAAALSWTPREGERVIVIGSVSLFQRDGACQLYGETLLPAGAGNLAQARDELKARLQEEGLFDQERKRALPAFARSIGIITAPASAAWADMERIIRQRQPAAAIRLYPALVQGSKAPEALAAALAEADRGRHDVLICGRGGGSGEDLSAFDAEAVVRAIAACSTPLICAVGHESDFSLADLAADLRAATPTHAATLAVPDAAELLRLLDSWEGRLREACRRSLARAGQRWQALAARPALTRADSLLQARRQRLDRAEAALGRLSAGRLDRAQAALAQTAARLELLSPLSTLSRGYALVRNERGGVVRDACQVRAGERLLITLARGELTATVNEER